MHRRQFLQQTVAAAVALAPARGLCAQAALRRPLFRQRGVAAALAQAVEVRACGADYLVDQVGRLLVPEQGEAAFDRQRALVAQSPLPVKGCNYFLGGSLRCTGPEADHARVLAFADTAFRRLRAIGGEFIVFGSSGSRSLPPGWPKARADEQFTALLVAMGRLAASHQVMVVVESLQQQECNYLTRLSEVTAIIAQVDQPHVRALADLYHLANMGETPADLALAVPWLAAIEIAERAQRTPPGTAGDDFRPYFAALAGAGFHGDITIEGNWTSEQLRRGFAEISRQAGD